MGDKNVYAIDLIDDLNVSALDLMDDMDVSALDLIDDINVSALDLTDDKNVSAHLRCGKREITEFRFGNVERIQSSVKLITF